MAKKHSHCTYCGHPFAEGQPWPRTCGHCAQRSYLNPLPVSVVLLPVDGGLLTVRRTIEPCKGELALPGGFIGLGESWQEAGARELLEESGIEIDPAELREFRVMSAPDGTLLVFGIAVPRAASDLPPFIPTEEASERVIITEAIPLAFPLHSAAVAAYFQHQGEDV